MRFIDEFGGTYKPVPENTRPMRHFIINGEFINYFAKRDGGRRLRPATVHTLITREEWPEDYFANKENNLEEHNE